MIHWKARRLLPQVLDGSLTARVEGEVRAHADSCASCTRALDEFEACERLLAELPTSLVPLDVPEGRVDRLRALSRWVAPPQPSFAERLGMSALGAFAGAAMLGLVMTGQAWAPASTDLGPPLTLAGALPISDGELTPIGLARIQ